MNQSSVVNNHPSSIYRNRKSHFKSLSRSRASHYQCVPKLEMPAYSFSRQLGHEVGNLRFVSFFQNCDLLIWCPFWSSSKSVISNFWLLFCRSHPDVHKIWRPYSGIPMTLACSHPVRFDKTLKVWDTNTLQVSTLKLFRAVLYNEGKFYPKQF